MFPQLRRALDATADELASLTSERANREQQHAQAQESIDALVAELQETLARLEQEQQQVAQLSNKLESTAAEHSGMQKQVGCHPFRGLALCAHLLACQTALSEAPF